MKYAVVRRELSPPGDDKYTWDGESKVAILRESLFILARSEGQDGNVLELGELRLRIVDWEKRPPFDVYVVRERPRALLSRLWYAHLATLRSLSTKVLWTCVIWGIVKNEIGTEPSWRNLFWKERNDER